MGYTTEFKGVLLFSKELTASELCYLSTFLGEDIRDHNEWPTNEHSENLYYSIDLALKKDFTGLEWTGKEKSYDMVSQVNYLISVMKAKKESFGLVGEFLCQGEEIEDRWKLIINESGLAEKLEVVLVGKKIVCPHCEESFILEEESK